ncbi:MAG: succinate dehydrogenase cytochrome b subunit [Deltaproteobacteria bacterium]|nr:succinate dehydrogenase cytochrome b subunit [Deltaproteobacteria bacterium]
MAPSGPAPQKKSALGEFFGSSIAQKYIVAITGLLLVLFVIVHLVGNLQMFAGQDAVNQYAVMLRSMGPLLWVARIGLIVIFVLHVSTAFRLYRRNRAARPTAYVTQSTVQASIASRTMIFSGSFVFLYIIGHLLHLTFGLVLPEHAHLVDSMGRHDVYSMVVLGFQNKLVSFFYIAAMLVLWSHLRHGISSMFQTVGVRCPRVAPFTDQLGPLLATVIVVGYIAIPLGVLAGIIALPPGVTP